MRPHVVELVKQQQKTFDTVFRAQPTTFQNPTNHYDWWMFPVQVPKTAQVSDKTRQFAVSKLDMVDLMNNKDFMSIYPLSIHMYLYNLQQQGWNNYPIRYTKMMLSLAQFIQVANEDPKFNDHNARFREMATWAVDFAQKYIKCDDPLYKKGLQQLTAALQTLLPKKALRP